MGADRVFILRVEKRRGICWRKMEVVFVGFPFFLPSS